MVNQLEPALYIADVVLLKAWQLSLPSDTSHQQRAEQHQTHWQQQWHETMGRRISATLLSSAAHCFNAWNTLQPATFPIITALTGLTTHAIMSGCPSSWTSFQQQLSMLTHRSLYHTNRHALLRGMASATRVLQSQTSTSMHSSNSPAAVLLAVRNAATTRVTAGGISSLARPIASANMQASNISNQNRFRSMASSAATSSNMHTNKQRSWLGLTHLAAATMMAVGLGTAAKVALADDAVVPSSGGKDSPKSGLQAVQDALQAVWADVELDLQRMNAHRTADEPNLKGTPPKAALQPDSFGMGQILEIVIPIRQGADTNRVLSDMVYSFRSAAMSQGGSSTVKSQSLGTSTTVQLEVTTPKTAERPSALLRAQLLVPPPGGQGDAAVTVQKRLLSGSGQPSFTSQEIEGLQQIVRTANLSFRTHNGFHSTWSLFDREDVRRHGFEGAPDLESMMREFESSFLSPFLGGALQGLFDEIQRSMINGHMQRGAETEDEGLQGHLPSNFPGWGAGDDEFGLRSGHGARGQPAEEGGAAAGETWGSAKAAAAVKQLRALGAQVFPPGNKEAMDWGVLAGYETQKRLLEDCLLLPLKRPDVYEQLAAATRAQPGSNRPRAVLFEGPPGTGKTTSARVISSQAAVPLVYLPLEAVLSKWYGESEGQLAKVFKAAAALGGAIIFIDELDALGGSRERGDLHEASRRLLSVLLREMDGFDAKGARAIVIGATNRKTDLDAALLSRFDMSITFGLPDEPCRAKILAQYAKQLSESDRQAIAAATPGMSGRDLRDVCEMSERQWASKIIRGEAAEGSLPGRQEYLSAARERMSSLHGKPAPVLPNLSYLYK